MKLTIYAAIGAGLLSATSASAVEITGGSLKLSYSTFASETDLSRLGIEGSTELAFTQKFSMQLDLGYQNMGESDLDGSAIGVHAIYHLDNATSLGGFYTREKVNGASLDLYGVEAGYETGQWDFEGNLGRTSTDGDDATIFGASARYEFANQLGLTGSYDTVDMGMFDISRATIALDRNVSDNVNLFLEVGSAKFSADGLSASEPFVGIGGKIAFGAERGATFDQRGILRLLPGL
ncbi:hypothetical protein GGR95_001312 [Sulfitobacter undariae]|uniref:Porin domain-containing protein n=1 Tax=Sulfitobacter undariae TaxID=1563671 RepID=A0A7W6E2P5_9RHOB|nr:porin [Sulfitobacter undariae]MBB3993681.1 hypothetical protein [Sulfitobacter undariae]